MPVPDDLPIQYFQDETAWELWLSTHAGSKGLWLKIAKKDSGIASVNYAQALDVALCHGWIDGQKRGFDEQFFLQRFTPRRPRSLWSKINIGKVEGLIANGRMQPAGLREVEAALAENREARAFFDTLGKSNRYSFCWRVQTAKKPETRIARAEKFVAMLAKGEKIHV